MENPNYTDFAAANPRFPSPTPPSILFRISSLLLSLFLLLSPLPAFSMVLSESEHSVPFSENIENSNGILMLTPGRTSGVWISELIDLGDTVFLQSLRWNQSTPSAQQVYRDEGKAPQALPDNTPVIVENGEIEGVIGENFCEFENIPPADRYLLRLNYSGTGVARIGDRVFELPENSAEIELQGLDEVLRVEVEGVSLFSGTLVWKRSPNVRMLELSPGLDSYTLTVEGEGKLYFFENAWIEQGEVKGKRRFGLAELSKYLVGSDLYLKLENGLLSCSLEGTKVLSSGVRVYVRFGEENLGDWVGPFTRSPIPIASSARFVQYRVELWSTDPQLSGAEGPSVSGIEFQTKPLNKWRRQIRKGLVEFDNRSPLRRARLVGDNMEGSEFSVEILSSLPPEVPHPGYNILLLLDLSCRSPVYSAELELSLSKKLLEAAGARKERVVLMHYKNGWKALPTRVLGEDSEEVRFRSWTDGFSIFAFVDNADVDFAQGLFENTENVDNYVRLISGYTLGRFTSRVFDAGGIAQWDNLSWSFVEPQAPASDIDYVGAEPDVLKDGSGRVGTVWSGSYANLQSADGVVENLSEASGGGGGQVIEYTYVSQENVYSGGTISFENAQAAESPPLYENLYEDLVEYVFFSENTDTQTTQSTDPVDAFIFPFTVTVPGDYLVMVSAQISSYDANEDAWVGAALLVDGNTYGDASQEMRYGDYPYQWRDIGWVKKFNFAAGSHTVQVQYWMRTRPNGVENAFIRNIRALVWKLPSGYQYAEAETESSTSVAAWDNVVVLTFTPPVTDNYLVRASIQAKCGKDFQVSLSVDGSQRNIIYEKPKDANDYWPIEVADIVELSGGVQHSIYLERLTTAAGTYIYTKYARICAIPLGKLVNFPIVQDTAVSYTSPNVWSDVLTFSPTLPRDDNYIIIANSRMSSTLIASPENIQNNFVVDGTMRNLVVEVPGADGRYYPAVTILRYPQTAGTHTYKIQQMHTGAAGDTVSTSNARIAIIQPKTMYLDVEHTIYAPTGKNEYWLQIQAYLDREAGDQENVMVYLWNFDTGTWDLHFVISSTTPTLYEENITGSPYILGTGKIRVRYVQGTEDLTRTCLMLDFCRVKSITFLPAGQSLNWQYTITGVTTGYENYDLKITAYSYNDLEYIWVDVWNVTSGSWEFTGYYLSRNTPATITYRLSPIENYLDGENVYVRFRDDSPSDATTTYIIVDMVRLEEAFWGTSDVKLQVRVSGDNANWTDWMGPDGTPNTYFEASVTSMENIPDNRYIQYRIYFWTNTTNLTGASGPKVDWVKISASSLPNLIYPIGGINLNNSRPTFQWETVAADNYHIQIATDPGFTNLVVDNTEIPGTENTWTPPSPLPDNFYYWRIQRYLNGSWYAWTAPETFRIDTIAPGPPTYVSPADGAVLNDNTPLLDWDPPPENSYPLLYQVWIAYDSAFLNSVPGYPTGWISTDNYEVPSPGLADNTYYWKVRAEDNAGNIGSWPTTYRSFRIDTTPPQVPTPVWPAPGQWTQARPNLDWSAVTLENDGDTELSTPILYEVQVSQDPTFATGVYSSGWISDDNWIATPCYENNTVWYWRVRAKDNAGTGNASDWSPARSFRVDNECPQVQLYLPENGAVLTDQLTVTLRWYTTVDGGSGLENYQIQIDNDSDFGSPLVDTLLPPTENFYTYTFPGIGDYYWRVRAKDAVGNWGTWSENRCLTLRKWFMLESWSSSTFSPLGAWSMLEGWTGGLYTVANWVPLESWSGTVSAPVPAPVQISPPNGINANNNTPTFRWENLQPADTYDLQVDNDNDWTNVTYTYTGLASNSYTPFSPYPDGLYYWRVRQTRTGATGPWSEIWTFRIDTRAPAAPILISPSDGENLNDSTPLLDWEPVTTQADGTPENALPVTYEIQVSNVSDFSNIVWSDNRFTSDNREVSVQLPDNVYYWRVRAWDNAGNVGSWSAVRSFRIDTVAPPAPILDSPILGAWTNGAPNLQWHLTVTENSKPIRYHIQIRLSAGSYTSPVRDVWVEGDEVENWIVTPEITTEEVYYWHVMAVDNAGNASPWSAEESFKVDRTPPNQVTLYKPDNNACTESLTVTLQWYTGTDPTPGSGVARYWIQISTEPDFSVVLYENRSVTDNFFTYTFPTYGRYYWRVCAIDAVGWIGPWSNPFAVHVGIWRLIEQWLAGVGTIVQGWIQVDQGSGSVSARASWIQTDSWTCSSSARADWRGLEDWHGTTKTIVLGWLAVEFWGAIVVAPAFWKRDEEWIGTLNAPASWVLDEEWLGGVQTRAFWTELDLLQASIKAPSDWRTLETWLGSVRAPSYWVSLDSWAGTVRAPSSWFSLDSCAGEVRSVAYWVSLESSTGSVHAPSYWTVLEVWTDLVRAPSYWRMVEQTSATIRTTAFWSELESYLGTVSAPVPAPVLVSPRDWENLGTATPTLIWDNLLPADSYWFQVATDESFTNIVVEFTAWVGKSYTHVAGFTDGLYYWRVCQTRTGATGPWSVVWRFRVDTLPPRAPVVTFPTDNLNLGYPNPTVTWIPPEENSLPLTYDLWVDNDSDFSSPEVVALRLTENSYTLPSLPDGIYYLRVRAVDNAGNRGENAQLRFRIDTAPPAAPNLVSPPDDVWANENVTLDWEPVVENSTPVMYRVQVSIYADFATIERDSGWIYADNWTVTPSLVTEYRYYWRVKARDNALGPHGENGNEGPWSAVRSFKLDVKPPSVPSPVSPSNNGSLDGLTVTLTWVRAYDDYDNPNDPWSSGVAYYVIQVSTDSAFTSIVYENTSIDNLHTCTLPDYGRYYWRVRAVDAVGHSSGWSENLGFHIGRWLQLESWTTRGGNVPEWLELESLGGTVSSVPVLWRTVEVWEGRANSPALWSRLESWQAEVPAPAGWISLDSWLCTVSAPAVWREVEVWREGILTPVSWFEVEAWTDNVNAPVPPPVLISPPDRSGYAGVTVTFTWENLLPADSYNIQIDDENTFSAPLVADNTVSVKSFTIDLPGTGTYYWRVRQYRDSDGAGPIPGAWSDWSVVWRVSVDVTPPAAPVLVSPRNWENLNDTTPLLDWLPVEENSYPVVYDILVYNAGTASQVARFQTRDYGTGENTQIEVCQANALVWNLDTPYLPDNVYYWKAYATDNAGWSSPASEEWYFRVDTIPPAPPALDSPPDNYKTNQTSVTLSWFAPPENSLPLTYYVAISDRPDFPYENENSGWILGTSWTATLTDGHWYWRVRARDNAGNVGDWSQVRMLIVDIDPPAAPILYLPENNFETNDNTVYFEWYPVTTEVTGAEEDSPPLNYYVSISDNSAFPYENYGSGWISENRWESMPIPDGVWYWRVRARDNAGNIGPWSEVRRMVIDTSVPTPPVPISPPDMDNFNNTTPTLYWENSWDLTTVWYKVWVATDNQFKNVVAESDWILENYWTTPALPDNLYYWRVQARDQFYNYSENSITLRFRVDTVPPAPPTPVWPVVVKTNDNSPNFRWTAPPENSLPLMYRVVIKNILLSPIHISPWVYDENYQYPGELSDDEYYWCVQARDDAGNVGNYTQDIWFRVDTKKPSVPQLISPIDGENLNDNTTFLAWVAVNTDITGGAEKSPPVTYKVWVATDDTFTNVVRESPWISDNYWEVTPALPDNVYYWRVCARDDAGNISDNSVIRSFRVDTLPPENVFLISPENGTNVGSQPNLDWNPAVDNSLPVLYRVLINRLGVVENYRDSGWIPYDNWIVTPTLPDNDYEWRVLARDNAGNIYETPVWWFRVETQPPAPPQLYTPFNGENLNDNTPFLSWENVWDVSRPVMFYVWVATDNNFTNVVRQSGWIYENWWEVTPALPDNVYYWRVCARDNVGNVGENSVTFWFRVDTVAPPAPPLISPENRAGFENFTVTFVWSAVEDVSGVRYEIEIYNYPTLENIYLVHENDNIWQTSYIFTLPRYDAYWWKVRAIDTAGNVGAWSELRVLAVGRWCIVESWSETVNAPSSWRLVETCGCAVNAPSSWRTVESWFGTIPAPSWWRSMEFWSETVNAPPIGWIMIERWTGMFQTPAPPELISPVNGTKTNDNRPVFRWTSRPLVDNYELWVDNDSDFSSPVILENTIENFYQPRGLSDENYFWRVRIWVYGHPSPFSATWSVLIDTVAPSTSLVLPTDFTKTRDNVVTFRWSLVVDTSYSPTGETSGIRCYEIWVDNDSDFSSPVLQENRTDNQRVLTLSDELYYWKVRVWDEAGNWADSAVWHILIDTVPPGIPASSPQNGMKTNDNTPTLTWSSVVDYSNSPTGEVSGVRYYELWVDNDANFASPVLAENLTENSYTFTSQLGDENYFYRVRVWDEAGNVSGWSSTWSFLVDTMPPSIPLKVGPSNGYITANLSVTLNWSPSYDNSYSPTGENAGVAHYELIIDNDNFVPPYSYYDNSITGTVKTVALSPGIYQWIVRAWDWAGNVSDNQAPWTFIIDITGPSAPSLLIPENGASTNATNIYFDWTNATDDYSGVDHYHIQVDNDPDFSSPKAEDFTSASYIWLSIDSDENYYWRVRAIDRAGNAGEWSRVFCFMRDTGAPPAPSLSTPVNGYITENTTITFSWSRVTDVSNSPTGEVSGIRYYELWVDNDLDFSSPAILENLTENSVSHTFTDENYVWRVRAWDWAGNAGAWSSTWWFIVDTTPPEPPRLLSPENLSSTNDNTPLLKWATPYDLAGVNQYEVWIDNDPSFSSLEYQMLVTENLHEVSTALSDENYYWKVRARDVLGHWGDWSAPFVFMIDTRPPETPASSSTNGLITKEVNPTLSWAGVVDYSYSPTGENSGVRWYELWIDNDNDFSSPFVIQFSPDTYFQAGVDENYPPLGFPDAKWYYRVRAWDRAGNAGAWSQTWWFIVDTTPPAPPAPLTPENGKMLNTSTVRFSWTIPDDLSGIESYTLVIDNDEDFSSSSSFLVTVNYKEVTLTDERYYWKVRAKDRAGNVGDYSVVFTFLLDTVPPQVTSLLAPSDGLVANENVQTFSWSYVIDLSNSPTGEIAGVIAYELWIDNDNDFSSPYFLENLTENFRTVELPDENWFWRVRVWDNAGNYSTSAVRTLLVDTRPPDIPTLLSPANGTKTNDNKPVFTWSSVVDRSWSPTLENSGVRYYEFWLDNDSDFSSPLLVENLTATSRQVELSDENWFWRVRVWDWAGNVSGWSAVYSILIDTVKPTVPLKATVVPDTGVDDPDNRVVTNSSSLTFSWNASTDSSNSPTGEAAGVRWYEIIIENVATGYRISENVTGTTYSCTVPEGQWRWWVRAWDWAGNVSDAEAAWIVVVDLTPPAPPTLISPSNGAVTNDSTGKIVFDWADATDEWGIPSKGAYVIEIDNSTAFDPSSSYYVSATVDVSTRTFFFFAGGQPLDERRYWHVKVQDNAGNWSSWSVVWNVLLDTLPPDIPPKVMPENGAILNSSTVDFAWGDVVDRSRSPSGDVAGLDHYQLFVSNRPDFSALVVHVNLTSSSYSTTLPDNVYYWKVRAWDAAGNASDFENAWIFIVDNNPPPAPSLYSPANGSVTNDNTPRFEWTRVYDVTGVRYELWVDNDSDFSSPKILENVSENYRIPIVELGDENYFWRVRAWDGVLGGIPKAGPFSEVWTLLIDTVPPVVPENSPQDGRIYGTATLTLSWNAVQDRSNSPTGEVSGIAYYEVQVSNRLDFSYINYSGTTLDNNWGLGDSGYPAAGFAEDNYYFRVRAWDRAGNTVDWSVCKVWNFVVDLTRPYGPALYVPENDAAENNVQGDYVVVTHVWESVKDASGIDHYEIQVATDENFTALLGSEYFSPSTPENLRQNYVTVFYPWDERYFWRVRAYDRAAPTEPGAWSQVYTLVIDRIKPLTPSLFLPVNGKVTSDNMPYFEWENVPDNTAATQEVSGVDHYILQIDTSPSFASPLTFIVRENRFTLPDENSLRVGTYYWRVRAVDRAGNQGDWSVTFTFRVLDLTISLDLSDNVVNPGESFTIFGRVSWQPDDISISGVWVYVYFDGNLVRSVQTGADGSYSTSYSSTVLGTHVIRVRVVDPEGVQEENSIVMFVRRLDVSIGLDDLVVNLNQEITASGTVTLRPEGLPENAALDFYLDGSYIGSGLAENGKYSWSYTLNFKPEQVGSHVLSVVATNADGIRGGASISFAVKTILISLTITDPAGVPRTEADKDERLMASGKAILMPDNKPVVLENVKLYCEENLLGVTETDYDGRYSIYFYTPSSAGVYTYRVSIMERKDYIAGENTATLTVKYISLEVNLEDNIVNPGQSNRAYGRILLCWPGYSEPVSGFDVSLLVLDSQGNTVTVGGGRTDENGFYSIPFTSPSVIGDYRVVVSISRYRGIFSAAMEKDLFVKTIWLSLDFDDNIVMLTQDFTIFGKVVLLPDDVPLKNLAVELREEGAPLATVVTNENGEYSYLYTFDSPAPRRFKISARTVNPDGIIGENFGYVEARELVFLQFMPLDFHNQFDGIVNPGENFYPAVQVFENNGIELIPVTKTVPDNPLRMMFGGVTYPMIYVREGWWRYPVSSSAPLSLGDYTYPVEVTGYSANRIAGARSGTLLVKVRSLELAVFLDDNIVNAGDNVLAYGWVRMLPEGTPVKGESVRVALENQEFSVLTDENGYYSQRLVAPAQIGDYMVKVSIVESHGLAQENATILHVKTISLSLVPEGAVAPENRPFKFTGKAILLPDNVPVPNVKVEFFVQGVKKLENLTMADGTYSITYTFEKRGLYEVTVGTVDREGIRGENSIQMIAGTPITIKGRLVTLEGYPIAGATFTFYEAGEKVFEITTDVKGYYYKDVFAGIFDLELRFVNRENAKVWIRFTRFDTTKLEPYSVIENLIQVDLPPSAFLAVPGTKMTETAVALKLHPIFYENFENVNVTLDFYPYLQRYWIQDVTQLRVYRTDNYSYENRSKVGSYIDLGGKVNITEYYIEAWDNTWTQGFDYELAYVLAEYDPLSATILQFQQAVETMQRAASDLWSAAEVATSAVENMKQITSQLQQIVSSLATQENVRSLMELQQQLLQLQENFLAMQAQLNQMQAQMLQLQENTAYAINMLQREIDSIIETINDIVYTIQQVQAGQADLADLISKVSSEVAGLGDRISRLENYQGLMKQDLEFVYQKLIQAYKMIEENLAPKEAIIVRPTEIVLQIYQEKSADAILEITSLMFQELRIRVDIVGKIQDFLPAPYTYEFTLGPREVTKLTFRFSIPPKERLGVHTGEIRFSDATGVVNKTVPVTIYVLPMARGMFDVEVRPAMEQAAPGAKVPVQVVLTNKGAMDSDVIVSLYLFFPSRGENIFIGEKTIKVPAGDQRTLNFEATIPENALEGDYTFTAVAEYPINGEKLEVRGSARIKVGEPTARMKVFGLSPWMFGLLLAALISSGISGVYGYRFYRKRMLAKKRFLVSIFPEELPKPGPTSIKIGKLAEVGGDAWLRLEDLRMHVITAGATGGGKTISSMVIVEEALMKGCNAIVFDPTAQWTGFLRKCTDKRMLSHYSKFGLKPTDARSFPGVVKLITNPRQKIDMKELLGEEARGKITIFVIERLKPGDLDVFVTNVIQSIFASQPQEYPGLKTLLVFDEVHRLLPKYGGTGAGVIQLERAVREFRKWGIGVMLVSQTIADFSETIQSNCRTQIQFWTREENELKRIAMKYGEEYVRSVSRASIGHAMVVNPDYNRGRPYYVNFRPILHSTFRLSPEELDRYYAADDRIENVKYKLKKLEEKGVDVFDLRIELGLAVRKLEEASFDLVNAYLDSLEPRVDELCAKHGLKGIKRVIELVPEEDIRRAQLAALRERERITRPPEIVEAYKEILGVPVEVGEEAAKPLKEELHPEFAKMKEEEEAAKAAEAAKPEEGAVKRARAPRKKGGRSK